jgi:hypothetical protein
VTAAAWRVHAAVERCSDDLFELMDHYSPVKNDAYRAVRAAYDASAQELGNARFEFTDAARAEAFLGGATDTPQPGAEDGSQSE